jgi:sterol 24-C-methyltransferase
MQNIPFPDDTFDAVYAIEATFHAPSLKGAYEEMLRVLKPGGTIGVYEWLMTDIYDDTDLEHRRIRLDIERGVGIAKMNRISDGLAAMEAAGFILCFHEDLAASSNDSEGTRPWYWPLDGGQARGDLLALARSSKWGRSAMRALFCALEAFWLAPASTKKTAESLGKAADAMIEGGKRRLFTPMYLMVGSKPQT